ncbi:MAG: lipid-A-disaccharide synthase [Prolixibacteraceae bacterium]|nr:lipid-A-disaccharide synthase [Prolixibacteraceae bacterium]
MFVPEFRIEKFKMMKYYLIAGEASGDLHGSNLIRELKEADRDAKFRFFGGDLMVKAAGGELVHHYREMAFMGVVNVVLNIRTIARYMNFCKQDLLKYSPDVLILIDYPGFNLKIAEFARKQGVKVFYYISPKVWAWKEYRIKKLKAFVDEIFTILPFETDFFKKHGIDVHYLGNPLMDSVSSFIEKARPGTQFRKDNKLDDRPVVALLAGSRKQEIRNSLPVMKKAVEGFSRFQFVVAGVMTVEKSIYDDILKDSGISLIFDQTYDLLNNSYVALVTSGTASLEAALFNIPQAVMYRLEGGWLLHYLMKYVFLHVKWVSLPNLILGREAVKEYLQVEMTVANVREELSRLLFDQNYRIKIIDEYSRLRELTGDKGSSRRTAAKMIELLREGNG